MKMISKISSGILTSMIYDSFFNAGISIELLLWRECKTLTSLKTRLSKQITPWRLKTPQSNDKCL